jgi:type VI secretion system secreted protein VgrG
LIFRSLKGVEQISKLFGFHVNLISKNDSSAPKSLLGQGMSIEIDLTTEEGGGKRFLSDQVVRFYFTGRDGDLFSYQSVLRPWLSAPIEF